MNSAENFITLCNTHAASFHRVVALDIQKETLLKLDFSERNLHLEANLVSDPYIFEDYISSLINTHNCRYGIGGYNELRKLYSISPLFDAPLSPIEINTVQNSLTNAEPRRLHLGTDIWAAAGTEIYAPLDGIVHSFADNNKAGDYGPTIILQHKLQGLQFYTLYGHLMLTDINSLSINKHIQAGEIFAHFGTPAENGYWAPHLHFQIILNMRNYIGDYPGVCAFSERKYFLHNSPDPENVLQLDAFSISG